MSVVNGVLPLRPDLGRAAYRAWAEEQFGGRYERVDGIVFGKPRQTSAHVRCKAAVYLALHDAAAAAGIECEVFSDGLTIEVGDRTDYEPPIVVNRGPGMADGAYAATEPVVVIEVESDARNLSSLTAKRDGYFGVPSIEHYLIFEAARLGVTHYSRDGNGIRTRRVTRGAVELAPPGVVLDVDRVYEAQIEQVSGRK